VAVVAVAVWQWQWLFDVWQWLWLFDVWQWMGGSVAVLAVFKWAQLEQN
jgi:hypothetical protein